MWFVLQKCSKLKLNISLLKNISWPLRKKWPLDCGYISQISFLPFLPLPFLSLPSPALSSAFSFWIS